MSVFVLLLGVVTAAAGLVLVASSITVRVVDADLITPGTIAAVGGLVLIGLGLYVRVLQQIEQALAGRSALRPGETPDSVATAEPAARIPFPPKPKTSPPPEPAVADAAAASPAAQPSPAAEPAPAAALSVAPAAPVAAASTTQEGAFKRLRAKFPILVRLEGAAVEGPEVPAPAGATAGDVKKAPAVTRGPTNGAAPTRAAPRLDTRPTPTSDGVRSSAFNAVWPATPRRETTAAAAVAAPVLPPSERATARGTAQESTPAAAQEAAPISVLKSGVIEDMAYTLYSDGSIEAQLPQGKLHFGSIATLRNHIERSA
ncbi:MAG: hypothetical protein ABR973_16930 [Candidatus Acidiferrales bacterium]|jgi:hypothetical protein